MNQSVGSIRKLTHNKITLALHELMSGDGTPLLVLHGLGESSALPLEPWSSWSGAVFGLDFTGHGESTVPKGGGYTCELLLGDVDVALAEIGPATILGRGLGAYVGLMIAGVRPDLVQGVVLADGPGLHGGGEDMTSGTWFVPADANGESPDPYALFELSNDVRPSDYATNFVHLVLASSALDVPLSVVAKNRPPWLAAVVNEPGVTSETAAQAFSRYDGRSST